MNPLRLWTIARLELLFALRRPLYWIWLFVVLLITWGLSDGGLRIQSGDATVGGTKAWITSEFSNAMVLVIIVPLFYGFFVAIAAGMSILRDDELRVGELLHATPLRPGEYVWGRFLAGLVGFACVLALHLGSAMFFNHVVNGAEEAEFVGPFELGNYLRPGLVLGLPFIVLLAGASFWIGERTRRPVLVFLFPVAILLLFGFFLWEFDPPWLPESVDRALMLIDVSGNRWLSDTYLEVDRGVDFYNTARVELPLWMWIQRGTTAALGLFLVVLAQRHFARTLRGERAQLPPGGPPAPRADEAERFAAATLPTPLASLGMRSRRPGFLASVLEWTRTEFRALRSQPGLYLFVPLIVMETVANTVLATGAFETRVLWTPGTIATGSLNWLSVMLCLLILFYAVESLRREQGLRLAPISFASPTSTAAMLFGKTLANSFVGLVTIGITAITAVIVLLVQGQVALDWVPFALVWGGLLLPTLILWSAFVGFLYAVCKSRYATYGLGLAALAGTGYHLLLGDMTWVTNWPLWGQLPWSDMSVFELDRRSLLLNRGLALSLAAFFVFATVRFFPRRQADAAGTIWRLRPRALLRSGLELLPFAILPLGLGLVLQHEVQAGFQGERAEKARKDYWRRNVRTYGEYEAPALSRVELELELDPQRRGFRVAGSFELVNRSEEPIHALVLSGDPDWRERAWGLDGEAAEPEERLGLFVFELERAMDVGATHNVSFSHAGEFPRGSTENGGGTMEFILPGGVVLTSFRPSFVPVLGFLDGVGVDEDNQSDAREFRDDFFEGRTPSAFGAGGHFSTSITISGPAQYTYNSVGVKRSDEVVDGVRTVLWESDQPVHFFNVVAGRWDVLEGDGTAIYYHPAHAYNVDEMLLALDASRRWYGEWFHPFPWEQLKLSEFPGLASYAQGFPTDITFAEGIGFLSRPSETSNAPFMITAHEAAHQWWGNILVPGRGPGGNILSEGMAHFSTLLLIEQVKGLEARLAFARDIETSYAESRVADSEKPQVWIDGSRPGDTAATYDKGGWVAWMLLNHIGREDCLEGLRAFIEHYKLGPDYPVLQDLVRHMRTYAPDAAAYDAFVEQWYFDVVVPRYETRDVVRELQDGVWHVRGILRNAGTGRMPVEVCAARGVRFPDEESEAPEPYREARVVLEPGAEQELEFDIPCDFEPTQLVVDPDALVLQLARPKQPLELP